MYHITKEWFLINTTPCQASFIVSDLPHPLPSSISLNVTNTLVKINSWDLGSSILKLSLIRSLNLGNWIFVVKAQQSWSQLSQTSILHSQPSPAQPQQGKYKLRLSELLHSFYWTENDKTFKTKPNSTHPTQPIQLNLTNSTHPTQPTQLNSPNSTQPTQLNSLSWT